MGGAYYILAVSVVMGLLVAGGLLDLALLAGGHESISEWLRANPAWYYAPALVLMLFIVGLGIHLFVFPES